jgi:hypothetical protein
MQSGIRVFNTQASSETTDAIWVAYLHPIEGNPHTPDDDATRDEIDDAVAHGEPVGMGATKALALSALEDNLFSLAQQATDYRERAEAAE